MTTDPAAPHQPQKVFERYGERDAPAEEPTADEEHGREEDEGDDHLLLFLVEPGRDEGPELVEDDRRREHQPADERQLEIGLESVARRGEVERGITGNLLPRATIGERLPQPGEDRFAVCPRDGSRR